MKKRTLSIHHSWGLSNEENEIIKNEIIKGLKFEENDAGTKDATIRIRKKVVDLELHCGHIEILNVTLLSNDEICRLETISFEDLAKGNYKKDVFGGITNTFDY